jgi:hypothetical protein
MNQSYVMLTVAIVVALINFFGMLVTRRRLLLQKRLAHDLDSGPGRYTDLS